MIFMRSRSVRACASPSRLAVRTSRRERFMNRLKDKIAIITGAASGQGAAEARLFATEGARVVLTDLNDRAGRTIASQIGSRALFVHHDVSDEKSWRSVINTTLD